MSEEIIDRAKKYLDKKQMPLLDRIGKMPTRHKISFLNKYRLIYNKSCMVCKRNMMGGNMSEDDFCEDCKPAVIELNNEGAKILRKC